MSHTIDRFVLIECSKTHQFVVWHIETCAVYSWNSN